MPVSNLGKREGASKQGHDLCKNYTNAKMKTRKKNVLSHHLGECLWGVHPLVKRRQAEWQKRWLKAKTLHLHFKACKSRRVKRHEIIFSSGLTIVTAD